MGCHSLLQGIFPNQGSNPGLLHWHVDSEPPGNTGLLCGKLQRHCTCPKAPLGGAFKVSMPNCFSPAGLFVTLWNVTHHAPLSIGFSRLECWNGLSFPSPGDFPDPGIKPPSPMSPALADRFFTTSATWEAHSKSAVRRNLTMDTTSGITHCVCKEKLLR